VPFHEINCSYVLTIFDVSQRVDDYTEMTTEQIRLVTAQANHI